MGDGVGDFRACGFGTGSLSALGDRAPPRIRAIGSGFWVEAQVGPAFGLMLKKLMFGSF